MACDLTPSSHEWKAAAMIVGKDGVDVDLWCASSKLQKHRAADACACLWLVQVRSWAAFSDTHAVAVRL